MPAVKEAKQAPWLAFLEQQTPLSAVLCAGKPALISVLNKSPPFHTTLRGCSELPIPSMTSDLRRASNASRSAPMSMNAP